MLLLPSALSWTWLEQHPKRLNLYACFLLALGGACWAIVDSARWQIGLIAIGVGATLVALQIA